MFTLAQKSHASTPEKSSENTGRGRHQSGPIAILSEPGTPGVNRGARGWLRQ